MISILFWLLVSHAVCDYPLQGDFLARGKNHKSPIDGVPWWVCLSAHAMIHAGGVAIVTGSVLLGLCEFVAHCVIDFCKCQGCFSFKTDQSLHLLCKILIAVLVIGGVK